MKKLAITLLGVAAATSMYGQGTFTFDNSASTATIKVAAPDAPGEGTIGQFVGNGYFASLYYGPAGSTAFSQLSLLASANAPLNGAGASDPDQLAGAGIFSAGTVALPGFTGNADVAVAVWWGGTGASGVATSYAQAVQDGYNVGTSGLLAVTLATGTAFPIDLAGAGLASFTVQQTPEPTTLALCGLGAASLLLLRRKKK